MAWLYIRLPEEIGAVNFKSGDFSRVLNSLDCPRNEKRPCFKSGPCCLGANKTCKQNKCHNIDAIRKNPLQGF